MKWIHWMALLIILIPLRLTTRAAETTGEAIWDVNGIAVHVKFSQFKPSSTTQKILFPTGKPVTYKLTIRNRTNRSFSQVDVQSSLHVQTASCEGLAPGARLPGPSISPSSTVTLAPGAMFSFDYSYVPPSGLCPLSTVLKVHLQYMQRGIIRAQTTSCPLAIELE